MGLLLSFNIDFMISSIQYVLNEKFYTCLTRNVVFFNLFVIVGILFSYSLHRQTFKALCRKPPNKFHSIPLNSSWDVSKQIYLHMLSAVIEGSLLLFSFPSNWKTSKKQFNVKLQQIGKMKNENFHKFLNYNWSTTMKCFCMLNV